MSISSIQYNKKVKEFTEYLVQHGVEPNNFEINTMLMEYLDNHVLGMPYYSPIKQTPYEESSKEDYNHNFKTLSEDLEVIYEANTEANNKAVAMQEYYDIEKERVRNAIQKLSLRVENITEAIRLSCRTYEWVEVFDDLYNVEFYGNKKRNIPYTTSFIDLLQKKVYTEKSNKQVNKILLENATITIDGLSNFSSYDSQGNINKILSDTVNDIYIINAHSSDSGEIYIDIIVDIGNLVDFNAVMFSYNTIRNMTCRLFLSDDGINYIPVYDEVSRNNIEWNFKTKNARWIKIRCIKSEPDGQSEDDSSFTIYDYDFLFKNISIALESFESRSVYVSKVIDFADLTSTIKLDATDMVFHDTRIDYFIGFDNGVDKIGWDAIKNHEEHPLFMFNKRHKICNESVGDWGLIDEYGKLYRVYRLPKGTNNNSIKLIPGYNMWSVKHYKKLGINSADTALNLQTGDFSNYIEKCSCENLFMDCENYDSFEIEPNTLYIFTQYVNVKESSNSYNNFIKLGSTKDESTSLGNDSIRIFVNGFEVTKMSDDKYSFALKKGTNKIQIAISHRSSSSSIIYLHHNINFKKFSDDVFAMKPMAYTTREILERMPENDYEHYTIEDRFIYVKVDPKGIVGNGAENKRNNMGYFLTFSCLREDLHDYFPDAHIKFRIMAVLTSKDRDLSPELINYRITGK